MTIADYRIDADNHVAVITWPSVEPTIGDWTATLDAVIGDPSFKPTFGILSDRRRGTSRPPRAGYVTSARDWMTAARASGRFVGRVATLTESADPRVFGMWLALESLPGDGYEYQVFSDLATALDWLNEVKPDHE